MKYLKLAQLYEELSSTTKRLEKIDILSKFLKQLSEKDKDVLYLLLGEIYPEYDERRIGISNQIAIKALSKATGIEPKKIVAEWKAIGDLGKVAEKFTLHKKQSTLNSYCLETEKVLENLRKLPELVGKGTVGKKLGLITELLTSADPIEAKYLIRTLIGDLRMGVQESTIRESLAVAFFKKEDASKVQLAIDKSNDVAIVFEICKKGKLKDLEKINLEVGKPIKAMLAQKAKDIEDAFRQLGKPLAIEYKYDGFRLLIHKKNNKVSLFTRRLENVTKQFPEVEQYIRDFIKGDSFILDSEAVGYDKKTKKYTDFQAISQRIRRKYNIGDLQKKLPVEVNIFDVLYYNGKSWLEEPFEKRRKLIEKIITKHPYKLIYSRFKKTSSKKEIEEFYKQALKNNQEGIMLKNLDAGYKPGRRVGHMLKLKPETNELDLVITGAEWGAGKRGGWLSSFILSCRKGKKFLEIGKVGTGILEKETEDNKITFENLTNLLKPLIVKEKGKSVTIKPKIVVQVHYQDLQRSPNYESKWALRFPRITLLREDRGVFDIASLEEIEKDFKEQKRENWKFG
ncbi:MAG: ATP-dependent DNA ligase [Nanoarchaeota archaeon]|nr:ATP-dependent DNA ligase [Nanoarchaeota archaeon]